MRRKFFHKKRVLAFVLSLSLVMGETAFAVPMQGENAAGEAAFVEETDEVGIEEMLTDETSVEETLHDAESGVSANDTTFAADEASVKDATETDEAWETAEQTQEATDEAQEAVWEEIDAQTAIDGSVSKVIGVTAVSYATDTYQKDGKPVAKTTDTYVYPDAVYASGMLQADAQTGWYSYNGKYYDSCTYNYRTKETMLNPRNEIAVLSGTNADAYRDASNGLYKIGNVYYSSIEKQQTGGQQRIYYYPENGYYRVTPVETVTDLNPEAIRQKYGRYVTKAADYTQEPDYYITSGDSGFSRLCYTAFEKDGKWCYTWYGSADDAISLSRKKVLLSWNPLSSLNPNGHGYESDDLLFYEVKINGEIEKNVTVEKYCDAKGNAYFCEPYQNNYYETNRSFAPGEKVTFQVRGVSGHYVDVPYTNAKGGQRTFVDRVIDHVGPWSDEIAFTVGQPLKQVQPVSGLTITDYTTADQKEVVLKWNASEGASAYTLYKIGSKKKLNMTAADFFKYYDYKNNKAFLKEKGLVTSDLSVNTTSSFETSMKWGYLLTYPYHYYAVVPSGVSDFEKYENNVEQLSLITTFGYFQSEIQTDAAKVPAITGFQLEKQTDGTIDLVWDKVDANVCIYAYDQSTFPKFYQYKPFWTNVVRVQYEKDENGNVRKDAYGRPVIERENSLYDDLMGYGVFESSIGAGVMNKSNAEIRALNKVAYKGFSGKTGRAEDIRSKLGLVKGKTYYFVACTYDATTPYKVGDEIKNNVYTPLSKSPMTYSYPARFYKGGSMQSMQMNAAYTYYPAIGPATNVVSAKIAMTKPYVSTSSDKKSIKLSMDAEEVTGYEIYRKSGKKYKKLAATTSNVFVDEEIKAGNSYTYKVRSYYYDRDTKKTVYSEYRFVNVKAIASEVLSLHAVKTSKTGVKLNWTKVANADRYEIYRSDQENYDPGVISKKYSAQGVKTALQSTGYKLIKTIKKAKTTSCTDKKLSSDQYYHYIIVAYCKDGKNQQMQIASDGVRMELTQPMNIRAEVKGSKVVINWDPDKFASGYEIQYTVYNGSDVATTKEPVERTTKKNTYTISGIAAGGYVSDIAIRAYNSKKEYSEWSYAYCEEPVSLGAVKGITARNVTTKDGRKGVKISWKKVSGAKYYKVYRSTKMPVYDADQKLYLTDDAEYALSCKAIAKEANDNYQVIDTIKSGYDARGIWPNESSAKIPVGLVGGARQNDEVCYKEYKGIVNSVTGTTAYDYADLASGVTYYYVVVACGEVGSSADSAVYSRYCAKPASVTASADLAIKATSKKGKVTLKWDKIAGASGVKYTIYRSTKAKGKYTKLGTTKKTSFTDKKSRKGATYYYKVEVSSGKNALKADFTVTSPAKKVKAK